MNLRVRASVGNDLLYMSSCLVYLSASPGPSQRCTQHPRCVFFWNVIHIVKAHTTLLSPGNAYLSTETFCMWHPLVVQLAFPPKGFLGSQLGVFP